MNVSDCAVLNERSNRRKKALERGLVIWLLELISSIIASPPMIMQSLRQSNYRAKSRDDEQTREFANNTAKRFGKIENCLTTDG